MLNFTNVTETKIRKKFFKNQMQMENRTVPIGRYGRTEQVTIMEQEGKYCNSSSAEKEKSYEGVSQYN